MRPSQALQEIRNPKEYAFAKSLAGKLWFWQPKTFRLTNHLRSYRPDFYVVEDGCFYEVVGTRQAYSLQRAKIEQFKKDYPQYRIEIVNSGAYLNGPREKPRR